MFEKDNFEVLDVAEVWSVSTLYLGGLSDVWGDLNVSFLGKLFKDLLTSANSSFIGNWK